MKHNEVPNVSIQLTPQNYENIFNVHQDKDDMYYYDLLKKVNFPENLNENTFKVYSVTRGDSWALIAWKHYRNVKLWWTICAVNQITNPTQLPETGSQIKIINATVIRSILNQLD
jgi:hypothetical protein